MRKAIAIDDDAYNFLVSQKENGRDSSTKVILRHVFRPADTGGELLELMENRLSPNQGVFAGPINSMKMPSGS